MRKYLLLLLLCTVPFVMNAKKNYGNKKAQLKVLIASENTSFKKTLVDKMVKLLDDKTIYITVVDHGKKELNGEKAEEYDAVFITASGVDSKIRPWIVEWLQKQQKKDHILLHITKTHRWETKTDVDSVTSASDKGKSSGLAREYVEVIKAYFETETEIEESEKIKETK